MAFREYFKYKCKRQNMILHAFGHKLHLREMYVFKLDKTNKEWKIQIFFNVIADFLCWWEYRCTVSTILTCPILFCECMISFIFQKELRAVFSLLDFRKIQILLCTDLAASWHLEWKVTKNRSLVGSAVHLHQCMWISSSSSSLPFGTVATLLLLTTVSVHNK